jgi:hypothetical protein
VIIGRLSARLGQELMQQGQWKESERLLQVGIDALDAELVRTIVSRITPSFSCMILLQLLQVIRAHSAILTCKFVQ